MSNLDRALRAPFAGKGWGPKFFLGGVLNAIGVLLGFIPVVGFFLLLGFSFLPLGYAYRVFRGQGSGATEALPDWGDWGTLCRQGLCIFWIILGYGVIPGVIYGVGLIFWGNGGIIAFLGLPFLGLGLGVGLLASFLLPMGLALYAHEGESLLAAFRLNRVAGRIWAVWKEYLAGWLTGLVLFLALMFLWTQVLIIGKVLSAFGFFYLTLFLAGFFGKICRVRLSGL